MSRPILVFFFLAYFSGLGTDAKAVTPCGEERSTGVLNAGDMDELYEVGVQLLHRGKNNEAIECLNQAKALAPMNLDVRMSLMDAFIASGYRESTKKEMAAYVTLSKDKKLSAEQVTNLENSQRDYTSEYQERVDRFGEKLERNKSILDSGSKSTVFVAEPKVASYSNITLADQKKVPFRFKPLIENEFSGKPAWQLEAVRAAAELKFQGRFSDAKEKFDVMANLKPPSATVLYYAGVSNYALGGKNNLALAQQDLEQANALLGGKDPDVVVALARVRIARGDARGGHDVLTQYKGAFKKNDPGMPDACIKAASVAYHAFNTLGAHEVGEMARQCEAGRVKMNAFVVNAAEKKIDGKKACSELISGLTPLPPATVNGTGAVHEPKAPPRMPEPNAEPKDGGGDGGDRGADKGSV